MSDLVWIGLAVVLGVAAVLVLRRPATEEPAPPAPRDREKAKADGSEAARADAGASTKRKAKKEPAPPAPAERPLAKLTFEEDDHEITLLAPQRNVMSGFLEEAPGAKPTQFVIDEDAAMDEPTGPMAMILLHAAGQTDKGKTRKRNEDSYLVMPDANLFVVADGMGGYAGGDVASRLAVESVEAAFSTKRFPGEPFDGLPSRASELVQSVEAANAAIHARAEEDPSYRGMGTTIVAARFSPRKQRLYVAHVGDSRCYRLREGKLVQVTVDHTMAAAGAKGPDADRLMRALGIAQTVDVDLLVAKPKPGDVYLLCTDGLSKMVDDAELRKILQKNREPAAAVEKLVQIANDQGGRDNVTVIVVRIDPKN